MTRTSWYTLLLLVAAASGCTTTQPFHSVFNPLDVPPIGDVVEVGAIWADGITVKGDPRQNGLPTPGFSGRVYLIGPREGEALAARGSLVVQLYDDAQQQGSIPVPREVWNIDQANLDQVLKKDGLGWGYNLWLPWSNYSPNVNRVSLIVKYVPATGRETFSSPTLINVKEGGGLRAPSSLGHTSAAPHGVISKGPTNTPPMQITTYSLPKSTSLFSGAKAAQ